IGAQKGAGTHLLGTVAAIPPAGHPNHDVGVRGSSRTGPGKSGSQPKIDQPWAAARPAAHQRSDDGVVGIAGRHKSLGAISLHIPTIVEAARITYLGDLGKPVPSEAVSIPAITVPSSVSAHVELAPIGIGF